MVENSFLSVTSMMPAACRPALVAIFVPPIIDAKKVLICHSGSPPRPLFCILHTSAFPYVFPDAHITAIRPQL